MTDLNHSADYVHVTVSDGSFNGAFGLMHVDQLPAWRSCMPVRVLITESMMECGWTEIDAKCVKIVQDRS